MTTTELVNKAFFRVFEDHSRSVALSVTYPVLPEHVEKRTEPSSNVTCALENELNYPCFQLYIATSASFLREAVGYKKAQSHVLRIISHLERKLFFSAFPGIRFEVYDGRASFKPIFRDGKHNPGCLPAISDHATCERENRNMWQCHRANLIKHSKEDIHDDLAERKAQASNASLDEQTRVLRNDFRMFDKILELMKNVAPEMLATREIRHLKITLARACSLYQRRLNLSKPSMMNRSSSTDPNIQLQSDVTQPGGQTPSGRYGSSLVDQCRIARIRAQEALKQVLSRRLFNLHVSISPNTFYCPPLYCWSNVLIVIQALNPLQVGTFIMLAGAVLTPGVNDDDNTACFDTTSHKLTQICTCSNNKRCSIDKEMHKILAHHLHNLGFSKPRSPKKRTPEDIMPAR